VTNNLILSGGISHPFVESSAALATLLDAEGVSSVIYDDIDAGLTELRVGNYQMLTVNALRWCMHGDKYDPDRAQWAYSISETGKVAIEQHVRNGGALLGVHTASICFDDWPQWREILGGSWQWGTSWHPPLGPVKACICDAGDILCKAEDFEVEDEIYTDLHLQPGVEVMMKSKGSAEYPSQALMWRHRYGRGRSVYDSLGHDAGSITQADHGQMIQSATRWLLANDDTEAK
jgi:type 1 glutamine amidotransferase